MNESLLLEPALVRELVLEGQWWRLWTGHLAHAGWSHLTWNLAGLVPIALLAWRLERLHDLIGFCLLAMPLISLGLLAMLPGLQWYAGLSGLLHGAVAFLLVSRDQPILRLALAVVAAKLAVEAWSGMSSVAADASVIWQAHVLGFALGLVAGRISRLRKLRAGP